MTDDTNQGVWESSFDRGDNFVFYPHEEVIRFVSKYFRKRVGLDEVRDIRPFKEKPRLLDVGCGIGRHIIYAASMGFDAYGIDLSERASAVARAWAAREGLPNDATRIARGSVTKLPWPDDFFDALVSHGTFDSMRFVQAEKGMRECARVIKPKGLFYLDLISGDDSRYPPGFSGEVTVETPHERGTIQSFFSPEKIKTLLRGHFEIIECTHLRRENALTEMHQARFHMVAQKA